MTPPPAEKMPVPSIGNTQLRERYRNITKINDSITSSAFVNDAGNKLVSVYNFSGNIIKVIGLQKYGVLSGYWAYW
jgi:hypothetical protein